MSDTIAAVATGNVLSAIGILRLSGPQAAQIAERCFKPLGPKGLLERPSKTLVYGDLLDSGGVCRLNSPCTVDDFGWRVQRNGDISYSISVREYRFVSGVK